MGHDEWPPLGAAVCFLDDGRRVGSNDAADGHEESSEGGCDMVREYDHPSWWPGKHQNLPECSTRSKHVLSQCPHDAIGPGAVAENVDGSCARATKKKLPMLE